MCFRGWGKATPSRRLRRLGQSLPIRPGDSPRLQACAGIVSVVVDIVIAIALVLVLVQVRVLVLVVDVVVTAGVCSFVFLYCVSISATRCLTHKPVM